MEVIGLRLGGEKGLGLKFLIFRIVRGEVQVIGLRLGGEKGLGLKFLIFRVVRGVRRCGN